LGFPSGFVCKLFEGYQGKVEKSVYEGRVHVDDIVASLECHAMGDFDVGTIVGVSASTVVGYIHNFKRKRIFRIGVCLAARIVTVEGGIDGNKQEIHLFGGGGLVCLGTLAQPKEIVEDKEVGGNQLDLGGVGKARHIVAAGFLHKMMMMPSWFGIVE
jgi:hypothetical protein